MTNIAAIFIFARIWHDSVYSYAHHGSSITVLYRDGTEKDFRVKAQTGKEFHHAAYALLASEGVLVIPTGTPRWEFLRDNNINEIANHCEVKRKSDM